MCNCCITMQGPRRASTQIFSHISGQIFSRTAARTLVHSKRVGDTAAAPAFKALRMVTGHGTGRHPLLIASLLYPSTLRWVAFDLWCGPPCPAGDYVHNGFYAQYKEVMR
jgi:hypothetical protein